MIVKTIKNKKIITKYIKKMQQLASHDMFRYYRYTRENQEKGERLKKFYEFEDKYEKYAKELEVIVEKMITEIEKKAYPLINGEVCFVDCELDNKTVVLMRQIIANNSNEELRLWLRPYATMLQVENGKITYNGS